MTTGGMVVLGLADAGLPLTQCSMLLGWVTMNRGEVAMTLERKDI